MSEIDDTYEVGFGKPPKSSQFRKGNSGNPKGRPKGSRNLNSIVLRESRQMISIKTAQGIRKVTKLDAAVMQLGNKAAQGELRAQREFFNLIRLSEETEAGRLASDDVHELDKKAMENLRRRLSAKGLEDSVGAMPGQEIA